jgi:hypothetical protein
MVTDDVIGVALIVAEALESVGAKYFVGGSLASSVDGEPRSTNDIDFVIDIPLGAIRELASALGEDFEVDVDMLREAVLRGASANAFYLPLMLKIDFFGHAHGPFDNSEFARRPARASTLETPTRSRAARCVTGAEQRRPSRDHPARKTTKSQHTCLSKDGCQLSGQWSVRRSV